MKFMSIQTVISMSRVLVLLCLHFRRVPKQSGALTTLLLKCSAEGRHAAHAHQFAVLWIGWCGSGSLSVWQGIKKFSPNAEAFLHETGLLQNRNAAAPFTSVPHVHRSGTPRQKYHQGRIRPSRFSSKSIQSHKSRAQQQTAHNIAHPVDAG